MTPVDVEEQALRRAVQSGDFAGAERSARCYLAALEAWLPGLPPAQALNQVRSACELTEWARRTLCAARARVSDELGRIERLAAYHQSIRPEDGHTWRIDG